MRLAIMAAAFGLVIGAPMFAPTALVEPAAAQDAQADPLAAEILAAGDDLNLLATIISRELGNGNFDGLALALASAARSTADTDVSLAATLVTQAVIIADSTSDDTQSTVGSAASVVATTAQNAGDTLSADVVETAVTGALDADMQTSYNNAGGKSNPNVTTGTDTTDTTDTTTTTDDTTTTTTDDTSTTGDDTTTTTTGDDTTTTTTTDDTTTTTDDINIPTGAITPPGGPPPGPPNQGVVQLPAPLEPPQSTSGSPV